MERKEIIVVTAFFSIGGNKGRTDEQYLSYFKSWAKLKNHIICYVESKCLKEQIESFRASIGLLEKTEVIIIENSVSIDIKMYESICSTMTNKAYIAYNMCPNSTCHSNPKYNYVVNLKSWCCQDATSRINADNEILAWIDFGFNHEYETYDSSSDFNFLWDYNFPDDKITVFHVRPFDNRAIFDIVFSGAVYITGGIVVAPGRLWKQLWRMTRENMQRLNACGLSDTDETILLMCYREQPSLFNVIKTKYWAQGLQLCGGQNLILKTNIGKRIDEKDKWFYKSALQTYLKEYVSRIENYYNNIYYIPNEWP